MCGQEEVRKARHNRMVINFMPVPRDQATQTEVVIAGRPAVCACVCVVHIDKEVHIHKLYTLVFMLEVYCTSVQCTVDGL